MDSNDLLKKAAYGALAGVAVTVAVQVARTVNAKVTHRTVRSLEEETGEPVKYSLLPNLPKTIESAGAAVLQYAYGSTGTAIYSALRSDGEIAIDGVALGVAVWAAGRLGWIPAIGLASNGHNPAQVASSLAQHLLFGIATVGAYRKLRTPVTS